MADVVWTPQPGSQSLFLSCPHFECLYEGTRGPGKTDALIMDFAQHVGLGFGLSWRGILFRETYKQLSDVVVKTKKWFRRIFPGARFNESDMGWRWPGGEELLLRYMNRPDDYWNYHGHEYPWIGWEELTNWAGPDCYDAMKACCRSSDPRVPRKYRATCNPFGKGHNWVKHRFIDPAPPGVPIRDGNGRIRVRLHGSIRENRILLAADPDYLKSLEADTNVNRRRAWLYGDWDIVAGGAVDDVWDRESHVLRPFEIPHSWRIDRSFDWGSSRPFSVGWWAESDGTEVRMADGRMRCLPRGTLVRVAEWYGWNGQPNEGCRMLAVEIAEGIRRREAEHPALKGRRVLPGPADASIFDAENGVCIADDMGKRGVRWERADKRPGSRRNGLEKVRKLLKAGLERPMEHPGLFVFDTCTHFIRTVPVLPRSERDPDDVETEAEDHIYDETRYRATARVTTTTSQELGL
ncbi:hypothetical protein GGQ74_001149 [Desulfobaculum xiamenense]|uniref:Terminase-like family protein n=1 Tax=Desulfobaculum xiamenense TaxID=995050 RepID=A0A846QS70_9BACT|nr:terminase family protein [Desulfobaculum xiamenense]NJB67509.1 hypothetical protein [Desulfobaculum xiamenense]